MDVFLKEPTDLSAPDSSTASARNEALSSGPSESGPSEEAGGEESAKPPTTSVPSFVSAQRDAYKYCAFIRDNGTRCRSYRVRKVPNSQGFCAAHLGITGIQRAPRAYGQIGGFASHAARRRRKLADFDSWELVEPRVGSEAPERRPTAAPPGKPDAQFRELERIEPALASDPAAKLSSRSKRVPAQDAHRVHIEAMQAAERKRREEEDWIIRLGGGDFERGLEIVERHRREAEERWQKKSGRRAAAAGDRRCRREVAAARSTISPGDPPGRVDRRPVTQALAIRLPLNHHWASLVARRSDREPW